MNFLASSFRFISLLKLFRLENWVFMKNAQIKNVSYLAFIDWRIAFYFIIGQKWWILKFKFSWSAFSKIYYKTAINTCTKYTCLQKTNNYRPRQLEAEIHHLHLCRAVRPGDDSKTSDDVAPVQEFGEMGSTSLLPLLLDPLWSIVVVPVGKIELFNHLN